MIVIDIETTGQDASKSGILSIGAVDFCNPKNQFYLECRVWDGAIIEQEALDVNGFSREEIHRQDKCTEAELLKKFLEWTKTCKVKTWAGMNPAFDRNFLKEAAKRSKLDFPFCYRLVDLHSVCYAHLLKKGIAPKIDDKGSKINTDEILIIAGLPAEPRPHNALIGAKLEAEAFSRLIFDKKLFEEILFNKA